MIVKKYNCVIKIFKILRESTNQDISLKYQTLLVFSIPKIALIKNLKETMYNKSYA